LSKSKGTLTLLQFMFVSDLGRYQLVTSKYTNLTITLKKGIIGLVSQITHC
jgi:hypothetical protein